VLTKCTYIYSLAISALLMAQLGNMSRETQGPQTPEASSGLRDQISVVIWTDHSKYALTDSVRVYVSLQNSGKNTVYIDRRMFWGGFGGGLKLEITDDQGQQVPSKILNDALMPPPREGDASILVRLEPGFFYGTWVNLSVKDWFLKTGKYSIRVTYKSWLSKNAVRPELRDLPAIWSDTPGIPSEPVWIAIGE
jgi:hypothetical protein